MRHFAGAIVAALLLVTVGPGLPGVSSAAEGQQPARMYRIGLLTASSVPERLRESLRELGYIKGQNMLLEARQTEGKAERVDDLTRELIQAKVDVIIATNPTVILGLKRATSTIPIVMVNTPDPVQLGLVASLARPGGNITGMTSSARI